MRTHTSVQRPLAHTLTSLSIALGMLLPQAGIAQQEQTRFEFHPHCEASGEVENVFGGPMPDSEYLMKLTDGTCLQFAVRDPESRQTSTLDEDDMLDFDIVIHNPERKPIKRFRAWIAYDSTILEGQDIAISSSFPTPTPGETAFFEEEGFIKISGTSSSVKTGEVIPVARIRMRVKDVPSSGTPMIFSEITTDSESKTGIFSGDDEANLATQTPGYLFVRLNGTDAPASSAASVQSTSSEAVSSAVTGGVVSSVSSASSSSQSSILTTIFTLLQVQGLRVTTEGSSVFLAWDALPSTELIGYNVYYGTVSGRYIQRRGVDKNATTLTLRALPVGVTYYFAVRGVNAAGQETEFSQEVGISVGNPATSTSPLTANTRPTATPGTNGNVAGDTGTSSTLLLFLLGSAVIGTFLAFRRQFSATVRS